MVANNSAPPKVDLKMANLTLRDIDADYGNRTMCCRRHGMLLVLAPLASLSLAGQEHGRTIPLADILTLYFSATFNAGARCPHT